MSIEFQCDQCFRRYNVKDSLANKVVPCKDCGKYLRVPMLATAPPDASDLYDRADEPADAVATAVAPMPRRTAVEEPAPKAKKKRKRRKGSGDPESNKKAAISFGL